MTVLRSSKNILFVVRTLWLCASKVKMYVLYTSLWLHVRCPTASLPWPPSTIRPAVPCSTWSPGRRRRSAATRRRMPSASAGGSPPSTLTGLPITACSPSSTAGRRAARGPGAGRPTKLYRRAEDETAVSVPERHYDLVGGVARRGRGRVDRQRRSRTGGAATAWPMRPAGRSARPPTTCSQRWRKPDTSLGAPMTTAPPWRWATARSTGSRSSFTTLVCGVNLQLLRGVVDGAGDAYLAVLEPSPGHCCVRLRPASR